MRFVTTCVMVSDTAASRAFYEGALGQTVMEDHGENVVFTGGFAIWEADHAGRIIYAGRKPVRVDGESFELYFESDALEQDFKELLARGTRVIHPPKEEPWGQRTFRCYDPDGIIVEVGEPMEAVMARLFREGHTPEAVAKRTGMPMEAVLQAIGHPRFC